MREWVSEWVRKCENNRFITLVILNIVIFIVWTLVF